MSKRATHLSRMERAQKEVERIFNAERKKHGDDVAWAALGVFELLQVSSTLPDLVDVAQRDATVARKMTDSLSDMLSIVAQKLARVLDEKQQYTLMSICDRLMDIRNKAVEDGDDSIGDMFDEEMEKIQLQPTVGMPVNFYPGNTMKLTQIENHPLAGIVAVVWAPDLVSLMVIDTNGMPHGVTGVPLYEPDDVPDNPDEPWAQWQTEQLHMAEHAVEDEAARRTADNLISSIKVSAGLPKI